MTLSDILDKTIERLEGYYEAEATINKGGQSYTIGNRTLTRPDLKYIGEEIDRLEKKCIKLGGGNKIRVQRVVPRDI